MNAPSELRGLPGADLREQTNFDCMDVSPYTDCGVCMIDNITVADT